MSPNDHPKHALNEKVTEWVVGHSLWELARHIVVTLVGAALSSYTITRMKPTLGSWLNVFLLVIGVLVIAWGIGLLPLRSRHRKSASIDTLRERCDQVILGWKTLGEDWQNAKSLGQPQTLPNPMDPGWRGYGFNDFRYPVGYFQAATLVFMNDLQKAGFEPTSWDSAHISMAQLLEALEKYRRRLHSTGQ